jgi:hypothetical protein
MKREKNHGEYFNSYDDVALLDGVMRVQSKAEETRSVLFSLHHFAELSAH